ncbi:GvpL/GvpF family gas vesicle protein [Pseudonocardia sp. CA-107938]|uniref:GvpL/GvpF family gas vesicle protein n=1 Tax=Pseudonocardia sp. CA-107938 TaxID=3240021 RepID=UPI003D8BBC70
MTATYVYGLVPAGTRLPEGLTGMGPGSVGTVEHDGLAAVVGAVPEGRALGSRADLLAHESVVDTVAQAATVLPMRFPAVIDDAGIVDELLAPHRDEFLAVLADLEGKVQYTLRGRYEQEVLLREIVEQDPEIRALDQHVRGLPQDVGQADRIRLGELVVAALDERSTVDAADIEERLRPYAERVSLSATPLPDEVITAAFLVDRDRAAEFEEAVEELGRDTHDWLRLRLLGPLAPYDFVTGR